VQLDKAVLHRHAGSQKDVKAHLRNLVHNLRCNGPALALYGPAELAALSVEQLAEDSRELRLREVTGRRFDHRDLEAERPWHSSYSHPPPMLSGESAWRTSRQRLVFCVRKTDAESRRALSHYFNQVPRVEIRSGNILAMDGVVDAFISPANTIGNMDGGIDRAYAQHFGWSFGRPYQDVNPLQRMIDAKYGTRAELPIGDCIVAPVEPLPEADSGASLPAGRSVRFLIAAPTMVTPGPIPLASRIPYQSTLAAFRACRERDCDSQGAPGGPCIKAVACPMFGTGWGKVPPWVAAAQMWEAFTVAWK
jgi:O-acetyl-ADP-ribose deacetylase (regulator of RNase III)